MCLIYLLMLLLIPLLDLCSAHVVQQRPVRCDYQLYKGGCDDRVGQVCDRTVNECVCRPNHTIRLATGACLEPKQLSDRCQTSAQCQPLNSACYAVDSGLQDWRCQCRPEYYRSADGGRCEPRRAYGAGCEAAGQCADRLRCSLTPTTKITTTTTTIPITPTTTTHTITPSKPSISTIKPTPFTTTTTTTATGGAGVSGRCVCADTDYRYDSELKTCVSAVKCPEGQEWTHLLKRCAPRVYYSHRGTSGGGSGARAGAGGRSSGSKGWFGNNAAVNRYKTYANMYLSITALFVILMINYNHFGIYDYYSTV